MLEIKSEFDRLRAVTGQKDAVKLITTVKNIGSEATAASVVIKFPFSLALDIVGLQRDKRYRIPLISVGETKKMITELYLKQNAREGFLPITITISEHSDGRFDKASNTIIKEIKLKVINP